MAKGAPKKGHASHKTISERTKNGKDRIKDSSKVSRDASTGRFISKKNSKRGDPPGL